MRTRVYISFIIVVFISSAHGQFSDRLEKIASRVLEFSDGQIFKQEANCLDQANGVNAQVLYFNPKTQEIQYLAKWIPFKEQSLPQTPLEVGDRFAFGVTLNKDGYFLYADEKWYKVVELSADQIPFNLLDNICLKTAPIATHKGAHVERLLDNQSNEIIGRQKKDRSVLKVMVYTFKDSNSPRSTIKYTIQYDNAGLIRSYEEKRDKDVSYRLRNQLVPDHDFRVVAVRSAVEKIGSLKTGKSFDSKWLVTEKKKMFGFGIGIRGDHVAVIDISSNSPASKSELKEGDGMLEVNGESLLKMTPKEIANILAKVDMIDLVVVDAQGKTKKVRLQKAPVEVTTLSNEALKE